MIGRSICRYLLQQVLVPLPCRSACAVLGIAVGYQECLAVCCPLLAVTFLSAQRAKICERFALFCFSLFPQHFKQLVHPLSSQFISLATETLQSTLVAINPMCNPKVPFFPRSILLNELLCCIMSGVII